MLRSNTSPGTPSPGSPDENLNERTTAASASGISEADAALALETAKALERSGDLAGAMVAYDRAIAATEASGSAPLLIEALRRLGVLYHHRSDTPKARELCERSYALARTLGRPVLAAETLNVLAGFEFEMGDLNRARSLYDEALELGRTSAAVRARVEQNLGMLSNIRGAVDEATDHYRRSLADFEAEGDERSQAIALHNLGMASSDVERWVDADGYFERSRALAERCGDVHLQALGALNHAEVHIARQQFERARADAESALEVFDKLAIIRDKADAYKLLGVIYRETGALALAEARLRTAIDLAIQSGAVLGEAESVRELARLYQLMGRNQESLALLARSHRLFGRLDAQRDLVDVAAKRGRLENTYMSVVREWGQSIESSDSYTFGHCERVATYGVRVAEALGLDDLRLTTIRLGAYLHDLGKVKVPHEVLNKPGKLTDEEFALMKMHPVWGLELLAQVEFPWDLKPIIRWHHEKFDGTGYPDGLKGEEIPIDAQIICIADVYDALTTSRSYRAAMPLEKALGIMRESRAWWRTDVFEAFMATVGRPPQADPGASST